MKDHTCEVRGFLHTQLDVVDESPGWRRGQPDSGQTSG